MCHLRVKSAFLSVLWDSQRSAPLAFQAKCSGKVFLVQDSQAEEVDGGLRPVILLGESLQCNYAPVCGTASQGYGN